MSSDKISEAEAAGAPSTPSLQTKLDYAKTCFANAQELNRVIDLKANFLISAVALLTAALGIVASNALGIKAQPGADWQGVIKTVGILLILAYLLMAFNVLHTATTVYRALAQSLRPNTSAPGLLFPLMLLSRSTVDGKADEDVYLERLLAASPQDLLHDYANQIIEVSNIYRLKQEKLNLSLARFSQTSILWVVTMIWLVGIIVLLP